MTFLRANASTVSPLKTRGHWSIAVQDHVDLNSATAAKPGSTKPEWGESPEKSLPI